MNRSNDNPKNALLALAIIALVLIVSLCSCIEGPEPKFTPTNPVAGESYMMRSINIEDQQIAYHLYEFDSIATVKSEVWIYSLQTWLNVESQYLEYSPIGGNKIMVNGVETMIRHGHTRRLTASGGRVYQRTEKPYPWSRE
jgi:hypothetical protein